MAAFLDGCRFNPAAGGTTDWTYSSVVPGYQSPAAAGVVNGRLYKYRAESSDLSQWELGEGAFNSGTGTFARTTVLFNSSGGTSKINFSTVPQVAIVALKEDLLSVEEANSFTPTQQTQARVNIEAAPFDALAYNNIIINGGMLIDQQNAGALTTEASTVHATDMWLVDNTGGGGGSASFQQVSDAPPGFSNSLKVTITSAFTIGAGDQVRISHRIEGYRAVKLGFGAAGAQSVTLGFWTKIHRTGTYSGSLRNDAGTRSYPFSFTQNVADTWEYKSIVIPGDTSGSWLGATNAASHYLFFAIALGSTFTGTANAWNSSNNMGVTGTINGAAATSDVFQITGVSLMPGTEVGSSARSPNLQLPFAETLQLCMRYLEATGKIQGAIASGFAYNTVIILSNYHFKVVKRTTPTLIAQGAATDYSVYRAGFNAAIDTLPTQDIATATVSQVRFTHSTAPFTAGQAATAFNVTGNGNLLFDARL